MEEYMGIVKMFSGNFAPQGWLVCAGQTLSIAEYEALFTIIGTTYGGDGVTTFNLPDLRCRLALGAGQATPYNYTLGERAGMENVSLTVNNLPQHTHPVPARNVSGNLRIRTSDKVGNGISGKNNAFAKSANELVNNPGLTPQIYDAAPTFAEGNTLNSHSIAASGLTASAVNTFAVGSDVPLSTVQPYLTINFIICVEGIYPSQN